ncbi:MAG: HK97 family phage prohead protease [Clostridia bacterium]|nr:HK97 family phage prohead protease [Clostridia bacterium]
MRINLREDSVELEGYVNAIERDSKPLPSRIGNFIERICVGAFKKALKRGNNVHILLNHDWDRDLGSVEDGNLELEEDNIGLRVRATITDKDVIEKARNGELVGWSFGFEDREVENGLERGMLLRLVKDLFLHEVSVLDREKSPAYAGTQVYARSIDGEDHIICRGAENIDEQEETPKTETAEQRDDDATQEQEQDVQKPVENSEPQDNDDVDNHVDNHEQNVEKLDKIDYSKYEQMIKSIKEDASC